jgi:hypothetical protein
VFIDDQIRCGWEKASLHFELVVHVFQPPDVDGNVADEAFLLGGVDRAACFSRR